MLPFKYGNQVKNLYEVLGVVPTAPLAEIKAAYRRIMSECHPDRKEGKDKERIEADLERSKEANAAWEVLSDEKRRAHYDATGKDGVLGSIEVQARNLIRAIFSSLVATYVNNEDQEYAILFSPGERDTPNFHRKICDELNARISIFNEGERKNLRSIKRLNKILKNIVTKSGEPDTIFSSFIEEQLEKVTAFNVEVATGRELFIVALELMKNGFKYNAPEPNPDEGFSQVRSPNGRIILIEESK